MLDVATFRKELLYRRAESQAGYFTAGEAVDAGMDRATLRYHARSGGRYQQVRRGLYRLRYFPSSPLEHVVAAWLPLRPAGAVVSHVSALELYDLADVIPDAVHVSLLRARRGQRPRPGVRIHTLERPPEPGEVRTVHGMPVTSPERSIMDCLTSGEQPEQIVMAIGQAIERGLTTPRRLRAAAANRADRIRGFTDDVLRQER
ncbi:MAG: type IV toxin-antitoxin system AbiEi family antitoxin domain-containing protein [Mycobacteriales bacterium]